MMTPSRLAESPTELYRLLFGISNELPQVHNLVPKQDSSLSTSTDETVFKACIKTAF